VVVILVVHVVPTPKAGTAVVMTIGHES
jgi:hypothetical protein